MDGKLDTEVGPSSVPRRTTVLNTGNMKYGSFFEIVGEVLLVDVKGRQHNDDDDDCERHVVLLYI